MVNWIGNEVDRWYIDGLFLYILMGNRLSINLVNSRRGLQAVYSRVNLKKWWRSQLSEDETTEFLIKTERTKCNNTQNIHVLLDGYYLLCKQYLQEKSSFFFFIS